MNVDSVSGSWAQGYRPRGWLWAQAPLSRRPDHQPAGASQSADTVALSTGSAAPLKESVSLPDVLKVAVDRTSDGVEVVTIYDPRTGSIITQMPPEQVIRVLEEILLEQKKGGGSRGDR